MPVCSGIQGLGYIDRVRLKPINYVKHKIKVKRVLLNATFINFIKNSNKHHLQPSVLNSQGINLGCSVDFTKRFQIV